MRVINMSLPLYCPDCGECFFFDEVLEDVQGPACPNCEGLDIELSFEEAFTNLED